MTARRTLASYGFVLPETPPKVGRKDLDRINGWHKLAVKMAIRDFLRPDLRGTSILGANTNRHGKVIAMAAKADGFEPMPIDKVSDNAAARETVAEWLGIPVEQIWPHHARTTTKSLHAQRDTPVAEPTPATDVEANTTLIGLVYSGDNATCNPFVHTVSKRLIGVGTAFTALVLAGLIAARRHGGAR